MSFNLKLIALALAITGTAFVMQGSATASDTCHMITKDDGRPPSGFGAAYDVYSWTNQLVMRTSCTRNWGAAVVTIGNGDVSQLIYSQGYVLRKGGWEPIEYTGAESVGAWLRGDAESLILHTNEEMNEPVHVLAYVCTDQRGEWKCGCSDELCATNNWQLQSYKFMPGPKGIPTVDGLTFDIPLPPEVDMTIPDTDYFEEEFISDEDYLHF